MHLDKHVNQKKNVTNLTTIETIRASSYCEPMVANN